MTTHLQAPFCNCLYIFTASSRSPLLPIKSCILAFWLISVIIASVSRILEYSTRISLHPDPLVNRQHIPANALSMNSNALTNPPTLPSPLCPPAIPI